MILTIWTCFAFDCWIIRAAWLVNCRRVAVWTSSWCAFHFTAKTLIERGSNTMTFFLWLAASCIFCWLWRDVGRQNDLDVRTCTIKLDAELLAGAKNLLLMGYLTLREKQTVKHFNWILQGAKMLLFLSSLKTSCSKKRDFPCCIQILIGLTSSRCRLRSDLVPLLRSASASWCGNDDFPIPGLIAFWCY